MAAEVQARPSKGEQMLWQTQYIACCSELNQWETVAEYAQHTENYASLTECLCKLQDWVRLKDNVFPKALVRCS